MEVLSITSEVITDIKVLRKGGVANIRLDILGGK